MINPLHSTTYYTKVWYPYWEKSTEDYVDYMWRKYGGVIRDLHLQELMYDALPNAIIPYAVLYNTPNYDGMCQVCAGYDKLLRRQRHNKTSRTILVALYTVWFLNLGITNLSRYNDEYYMVNYRNHRSFTTSLQEAIDTLNGLM